LKQEDRIEKKKFNIDLAKIENKLSFAFIRILSFYEEEEGNFGLLGGSVFKFTINTKRREAN
jgi:hypothetical protein